MTGVVHRFGIALLLTGALMLHLFMLTAAAPGAQRSEAPLEQPLIAREASAPHAADHGHHGATDLASTCFTVIAVVVGTVVRLWPPRRRLGGAVDPTNASRESQLQRMHLPKRRQARAGPGWLCPIESGVLLRV